MAVPFCTGHLLFRLQGPLKRVLPTEKLVHEVLNNKAFKKRIGGFFFLRESTHQEFACA